MDELDDIIDLDGENGDPLDKYMVMDESIGNLWTTRIWNIWSDDQNNKNWIEK